MEKKIEIKPVNQIGVRHWVCRIIDEDGYTAYACYGSTKEEAESNARIAAKGYLVEDMIPHLEDYLKVLKWSFSELSPNVVDLTELLTKAKM